jgi:phosphoribosyl 1,2-cyclic phosphodiesterase
MKVKFWGTRGSIAVPGKDTTVYGGNTTCIEITLETGRKIIIDAGTGIRPLGNKLCEEGDAVDVHLLITHIHWDHVLGFPFFAPIYEPTTKISVDGFRACMKGLRYTFDNKIGDGFFPVKFEDLKAEIRHLEVLSHGPLKLDDVVIETISVQHPQGGVGFRFDQGGKRLVFITDNELTNEPWAKRHPEDFTPFCKDADILIHDAQYTLEEIRARRGWGHSDYAAAVNLALEARVKRFIFFHHNPSRKDHQVDSLRARCEEHAKERGADLPIEAAREGVELTL